MRKHLSLALALVLCLSLLTTGAWAAEGTVTVPDGNLSEDLGQSGALVDAEYVFDNYQISIKEDTTDEIVDYVIAVTADNIAWYVMDGHGGYWCPVAFIAPEDVTTVSIATARFSDAIQIAQKEAKPLELSDVPVFGESKGFIYSVDAIMADEKYISVKWGDSEWVTYYIDTKDANIASSEITLGDSANYLYGSITDSLWGWSYNYRLDITLRGVRETTHNGVTGNWTSFTVEAPAGAVTAETGASSTSTDLILANPTRTDIENGGVSFYKDLGDITDNNRVFAVRWLDGEGKAIGTDIIFANYLYTLEDNRMIIEHVYVYDEGGDYLNDVTASVVDGTHIVLSGEALGSIQTYTIELVTSAGRLRIPDIQIDESGAFYHVQDGEAHRFDSMRYPDLSEETIPDEFEAESLVITFEADFDTKYEHVDKIETGNTQTSVSGNIPAENKDTVEDTLNSIEALYDLTNLAMEQAVPVVNDIPGLTEAAGNALPGATDVSVVVKPYIEVEATEYDETDGTFKVEITAKYDTYAVAGNEEKKLENLDGASGELQLDEPITISIDLPGSYTSDSVYVIHQKNNKYYYYDANVSVNDEKMHVIFTSHNGLSPFEFVIGENPSVAKIGGVGYGTLQEAIDDADDNAIITLLKNGTAVIDREVIFTISNPNGYTANITAANGYRLVENNGVYTVVEDTTPSRPGSSVGSSTYRISVVQPEGGTIETNVTRAAEGDTVRVTATPDEGYHLVYITVDDERISGTSFEMPDHAVEVSAVFERDGEEPPFTDVEAGDWFYEYVQYVYENGLMDGVSDTLFNPDGNMTRAMFWAVLARIDGETVTGDTWMEDARAWAMESGVSDGTEPEANVTREMLVTMLYRYAGLPETDGSGAGIFDDGETVSVWAYDAMSWALNNGVITGVSDDMLLPGNTATRAQCAAILMRYMELQAE